MTKETIWPDKSAAAAATFTTMTTTTTVAMATTAAVVQLKSITLMLISIEIHSHSKIFFPLKRFHFSSKEAEDLDIILVAWIVRALLQLYFTMIGL